MKKNIIIILIFVLALGGAYFIIRKVFTPRAANYSATPTTRMEALVKQAALTDSDLDGLSNDEEKKLGTDPNKADTDGDGLLDKDEVNLFKTDPLKRDTDGDGYNDGYEARRGTDPKNSTSHPTGPKH